MNKIMIAILLGLGLVACQQKTNQEIEAKGSDTETKTNEQVAPKFCTKDLKICPDGNSVARNPKNNCEFDICNKVVKTNPKQKEAMMCTADVKECPDGSFVGRNHYNNCKFKNCPNGDISKDEI